MEGVLNVREGPGGGSVECFFIKSGPPLSSLLSALIYKCNI